MIVYAVDISGNVHRSRMSKDEHFKNQDIGVVSGIYTRKVNEGDQNIWYDE